MRSSDALGQHCGLNTQLPLLLLGLVAMLLAACDTNTSNPEEPEEPKTYQVTEGACGKVVFAESLGTDSLSATEAVETQKIEKYGPDTIRLEAYVLEVVGEDGNVPEPEFYALRVLDAKTGHLMHSVLEVVTNEGDLFTLRWCPD